MYAPKDDSLHRKLWRKLYDELEQENLKSLITSAESNGISFVYAISPGLDMIFSCPKDVQVLKNKLKQVADLGCKSFALLFDDIEPELSLPDREDFDSFADAQVAITNSIYDFLGKPNLFLFCPTEYCTTRAKPSVEKSEYLRTLGRALTSNIDVLWTGPKVISRDISISSLELVTKVLKRKPVIWDNIHANDYDQRRVFLGPFDGRPTEIYQQLNGILTNPNCEYEMNFVAVHTIAQWVRCCNPKPDLHSSKNNEGLGKVTSFANDSHIGECDMEVTEPESCKDEGNDLSGNGSGQVVSKSPTTIGDGESISNEVKNSKENGKEILEMTEYDAKVALENAVNDWLKEFNKVKLLNKSHTNLSTSPSKVVTLDSYSYLAESDDDGDGNEDSIDNSQLKPKDKDIETEDNTCCPHHMSGKRIKLNKENKNESNMTKEDLLLMIDLFFLPYEHGGKAKHLLSEFRWLRANVPPIKVCEQGRTQVEEWGKRAANYRKLCQDIKDMFHRVSRAPNKPLVQELYPYVWDMKEVAIRLEEFLKWLGSKNRQCKEGSNQIPEDPEPWMFKGGVAEELERLLPVSMVNELSPEANTGNPNPIVYTIRPYLETDKSNLYNLCTQFLKDEVTEKNLFPNYSDLPGDWLIGTFVKHTKELTFFILENQDVVLGYCGGVFDAKDFNEKSKQWFSEISEKYDSAPTSSLSTHEELLIRKICKPKLFLPDELYQKFPAQIFVNLLPRVQISSICKGLLSNVILTMKSRRVKGIHCQIDAKNQFIYELLSNSGFTNVSLHQNPPDGISVLGMETLSNFSRK